MGWGVKADPLTWLKKPSWNLSVSCLGRSVPKLSPITGALKGLNYPESWSNLMRALVEQERNKVKREWCSEALSMLLCCCTSRASAIVRICSSCFLQTKEKKNMKPY